MIIVRLLLPEPCWLAFGTTNFTRDLGADIVMESITLRRKSRITHLESIGARNELSSLWVGRRPMGTQNPGRWVKTCKGLISTTTARIEKELAAIHGTLPPHHSIS